VHDLHCHLLPGIDDGVTDVEEAVRLARSAQADGVRTIAATPHLRFDHPAVHPTELASRCEALRSRLRDEGVTLEVLSGGEIDTAWSLDATDEELRLVSYGQRGTDLLVETPYTPLTATFEHVLFRLQLAGYRLLLAHPERNVTLRHDRQRLEDLVERGVLLQVTAASIVQSARRSSSSEFGRRLVRDGLAHTIASDLHHPEDPGRASLAEGAAAASELVGPARARWMVDDAPAAIAQGLELSPPPPLAGPRGGTRMRFWRRRGQL